MSVPESILANLRELNAWHLSSYASCSSPDSLESIGATWLCRIRDSAVEAVESLTDDDAFNLPDSIRDNGTDHEIADSAVPIYTNELWSTFVDVGGYNEDPTEYGTDTSDMDSLARVCLFMIAERVVSVVVDDVAETLATRLQYGLDEASNRGTLEGAAAASWVDVNEESAPIILAGIADVDPEIMDDLPTADLSGQIADVTTVADLLADADLSGIDVGSDIAQQLADAYEAAFTSAVEEKLTEACNYQING